MVAGFDACRGRVIALMDADLQHPPEEIPRLLTALAEGYDVVYGLPEKTQHGMQRDFASRMVRRLLKMMHVETAATGGNIVVGKPTSTSPFTFSAPADGVSVSQPYGFRANNIALLQLVGGTGPNLLVNDTDAASEIYGGPGNDILIGSPTAADHILSNGGMVLTQ